MDRGEFEASAPRQVEPSVVIKRRGNKGLLISTIIFGLATVGLGVFLAITLLNPPKKDSACNDSDKKEEIVETPDEDKPDEPDEEPSPTPDRKSTDARLGYVTNSHCSYLYLTKNGEAYATGGSGCPEYDSSQAVTIGSANNGTGTIGNYSLKGSEFSGSYFIGGEDVVSIENGLKLDESGIVAAAPAEIGQNWVGDIYVLVKEDGTIDILYLIPQYPKANFKATLAKNVGNYKNIASAVAIDGGDHVSTMLITRNGGHVSLEDTLNNWLSENN